MIHTIRKAMIIYIIRANLAINKYYQCQVNNIITPYDANISSLLPCLFFVKLCFFNFKTNLLLNQKYEIIQERTLV